MDEVVRIQSDVLLYRMLKASLRYHKYLYYGLDENEISDQEYDALEARFNKVAAKLAWEGSWVGYNSMK